MESIPRSAAPVTFRPDWNFCSKTERSSSACSLLLFCAGKGPRAFDVGADSLPVCRRRAVRQGRRKRRSGDPDRDREGEASMALGRALLCAAIALIATSASAVTNFSFVSGSAYVTASATCRRGADSRSRSTLMYARVPSPSRSVSRRRRRTVKQSGNAQSSRGRATFNAPGLRSNNAR